MKVDKFSVEVHRRLCAMPEPINPIAAMVRIANQVAREHPFWYERFRIDAMIRRLLRR